MRQIYLLMSNIIISITILMLYRQIKKSNLKRITFYCLPPLYVMLRNTAIGNIVEPFRIILSFFLLGIILFVFEKKTLWISLLLVFAIAYILSLLSMLLAAITAEMFLPFNELAFLIIGLIYPLLTLLIISILEKKGKTLSQFAPLLETPLIRKIILIIGLSVIAMYSFIEVTMNLGIYDFRTSLALWTVFVSIILIITLLIIFGASHFRSERKAKKILEEENRIVIEERAVVEKQLSELNQVYAELQKDFGTLTSTHHNYKYLVPMMLNMQHKLINELHAFEESSHDEKIERLRNYTDHIRAFSFQVNDEFVSDYISTEVSKLDIPDDYLEIKVLLEELMSKAQESGIYISVYNYLVNWGALKGLKIAFLRMFGNIVDNAIKESCKIPELDRGEIKIIFKDDEEYFSFEIIDSAPEFEIFVLKNIGTRKISTNGTGDGYAEIMADLKETNASLVLKEWRTGNNRKSISVIFDGYGMRLIDSQYRQELLINELIDSVFEIMDF